MLVDFAGYHTKHLVSRKVGGQWLYEPVNPQNPYSGKHLASEQIFSNHGLGVALYVRNQLDDAYKAVGVFTALKLSFSRKVDGTYLLSKDVNHISVALDLHGVRQLYTWATGSQMDLRTEIVKPGASPKTVIGYRMDRGGQFPHALKVIGPNSTGEQVVIDVGLNDGDLFTIAMFCIGYCKLLYPVIDGSVIERLLAIPQVSAATGEGDTSEKFVHAQTSEPAPNHLSASAPQDRLNDKAPLTLEQRPDDVLPTPGIFKQQKAIFAVGMNKWPKKNRATIEYIQEVATPEAMDRLIKAGNAGDFTEWDKVAEPFL